MLEVILGFIVCLAAPVVVYAFMALRYVPPPFEWVIEINLSGTTRKEVWKAGLHLLLLPIRPFMFVRSKMPMNDQKSVLRVGQKEGEGTEGKIELADASAAVIAQVVFRVVDSIKATYEIDDYHNTVVNKIEALIRQFLGGKDLDEALKETTKAEIIEKVTTEASGVMASWGVKLVDVSIIDFVLDEETDKKRREILNATKEAEAEAIRARGRKRAAIHEAEGESEAIKLKAEAEKLRQVLLGEGEGDHIKIIAEKTGSSVQEVMAFIRSPEYFKALEGSTIFSFSEGGGLNFPAAMAAILKAFSEGMGKGKGGSTT